MTFRDRHGRQRRGSFALGCSPRFPIFTRLIAKAGPDAGKALGMIIHRSVGEKPQYLVYWFDGKARGWQGGEIIETFYEPAPGGPLEVQSG